VVAFSVLTAVTMVLRSIEIAVIGRPALHEVID
jgi:hypothetical protein